MPNSPSCQKTDCSAAPDPSANSCRAIGCPRSASVIAVSLAAAAVSSGICPASRASAAWSWVAFLRQSSASMTRSFGPAPRSRPCAAVPNSMYFVGGLRAAYLAGHDGGISSRAPEEDRAGWAWYVAAGRPGSTRAGGGAARGRGGGIVVISSHLSRV